MPISAKLIVPSPIRLSCTPVNKSFLKRNNPSNVSPLCKKEISVQKLWLYFDFYIQALCIFDALRVEYIGNGSIFSVSILCSNISKDDCLYFMFLVSVFLYSSYEYMETENTNNHKINIDLFTTYFLILKTKKRLKNSFLKSGYIKWWKIFWFVKKACLSCFFMNLVRAGISIYHVSLFHISILILLMKTLQANFDLKIITF